MTEPTQADRLLTADILDEVSDLLDNVGIGQVADLIRDGEYDEHETVKITAAHREASTAALSKRVEELEGALIGHEQHMARMQDSVIRYLTDKLRRDHFIDAMIYLLDGPEQRAVQKAAKAALGGNDD